MVKPVQHEFCLTAITCEMLPICTALLQVCLLYEHEETTLKFYGNRVLVFIAFVLRVPYYIHFIWPLGLARDELSVSQATLGVLIRKV